MLLKHNIRRYKQNFQVSLSQLYYEFVYQEHLAAQNHYEAINNNKNKEAFEMPIMTFRRFKK